MSVFKTWDLWRQAYTAAGYVDDEEQDMTTLREAAQQALEYLDAPSSKLWPAGTQHRIITALRAALAEPVEEPVAWMHTNAVGHVYFRKKPQDRVFNPQPLYTAPPQRKPLTDEEIINIGKEARAVEGPHILPVTFARAIEAAHGSKP